MIVAIDGPAASGKGTLARRIAAHYGFAHLDTGALYRAVALALLRAGRKPEDREAAVEAARELDLSLIGDPELRTDRVGNAASIVAALPAVREALVARQRTFARRPPDGRPGAVLDGRDIGTVICPDADAKIFVTASVEARARRRHKELLERGETIIYARVLQEMRDRDARDSGRKVAPLVAAADAFVLDTTDLDADGAFKKALEFLSTRI